MPKQMGRIFGRTHRPHLCSGSALLQATSWPSNSPYPWQRTRVIHCSPVVRDEFSGFSMYTYHSLAPLRSIIRANATMRSTRTSSIFPCTRYLRRVFKRASYFLSAFDAAAIDLVEELPSGFQTLLSSCGYSTGVDSLPYWSLQAIVRSQ